MRAWSRHRPDGAMLRAATIVNGSTVCCVQSDQGTAVPLVNAPPSRRVILRMMRRERSRGSQVICVPTTVLGSRATDCDVLRIALDAVPCGRRPDARSVGRWPLRRMEGVPCGTDAMTPTYARAISSSSSFERSARPPPSRNCLTRAARRRRQCPKARPSAGSKRSEEH